MLSKFVFFLCKSFLNLQPIHFVIYVIFNYAPTLELYAFLFKSLFNDANVRYSQKKPVTKKTLKERMNNYKRNIQSERDTVPNEISNPQANNQITISFENF